MRDLPRLPVAPESVEQAQHRFHKALGPIVDVEAIERGDTDAYYPTKFRQHVFDVSGVRMCVSRDRSWGLTMLHASVSFYADGAGVDDVRYASLLLQLIGDTHIRRPPDTQEIADGIVHWFWEETTDEEDDSGGF